jgi:ribosomal protein S18 acetylase RimI-like enzyme
MKLRLAKPNDAHAIARVHVLSWRAAYRSIVPDEYLNSLSVHQREIAWTEMLQAGVPEVWVSYHGNDIVGWVSFGASRDLDAQPSIGEVEAIYVLAERWSTGAGKMLWLKARMRLVERGFDRLTLWVLAENARAIRFYRAAGMRPSVTRTINIGGKDLSEVRYEMSLKSGAVPGST